MKSFRVLIIICILCTIFSNSSNVLAIRRLSVENTLKMLNVDRRQKLDKIIISFDNLPRYKIVDKKDSRFTIEFNKIDVNIDNTQRVKGNFYRGMYLNDKDENNIRLTIFFNKKCNYVIEDFRKNIIIYAYQNRTFNEKNNEESIKLEVKQPTDVYFEDSTYIKDLMNENKDLFSNVLNAQEDFDVQIILTKIKRNEDLEPSFEKYQYNADRNKYFFPASMIKLPIALLALEKINNLNIDSLSSYSIMNVSEGDVYESTQKGVTIRDYIKKMIQYSDNNSYNMMYDFLGQQYINETLWDKGYDSTKILTRLAITSNYEQNRNSNEIKFYNGNDLIYSENKKMNPYFYKNEDLEGLIKGIGHMRGEKVIQSPKDFTYANYISVEDLHDMLKTLFFEDSLNDKKGFDLNTEDKQFLKECLMGDNNFLHNKYFLSGQKEPLPNNIEMYNKIGIAYGFISDNAYIIDKKNDVEFILTAVIYTNENGIIGDGVYEYYTIGMPFLKNIGKVVLEKIINEKIINEKINNY